MTKPEKGRTPTKAEATHFQLPDERSIDLPPRDYEPTKAEKEETFDMPGADVETVRSAFFRTIRAAD